MTPDRAMQVTRHATAESFLNAAKPCLMAAEAENNLIIGIVEGLARTPADTRQPYLATVADGPIAVACAVYLPRFRLQLTRVPHAAVAALARDVFAVVPDLEGVSGPERSSADFAAAWSGLRGVEPRIRTMLRIYEARTITSHPLPAPPGSSREATDGDHDQLTRWTEAFVADADIQDAVDAAAMVRSSLKRKRLYVWDDDGIKSMAAWVGRTPNGVRINFIFTPREFRGRGYATACVGALARLQLQQGCAFCWLYTRRSPTDSGTSFKRIGFRPVSDVVEYDFPAS